MRTLDQFAAEAEEGGLDLRVDRERLAKLSRVQGDGLFHIPLVALAILVVARGHKRRLETAELAPWTGAILGKLFSEAEAAHRKLEWSLQHRKRCADALIFLENIQLVAVHSRDRRIVQCTAPGLDFLRRLQAGADDAGLLVRGLERAYRSVFERGLELL